MNKSDPFEDVQSSSELMSDADSQSPSTSTISDEPIQADHVGALLCATRMRLGGDLQEIAKLLRIRYGYLVAIEDGRYEDLPGAAYSTGFVRAYADFLGLDGNEVVRRLRQEAAGGTAKVSHYSIPATGGDSGLPNAGLLAIAIGLGMVVYGAWYTMVSPDRDGVALIQEVPDRLSGLLDDGQTGPTVAEAAMVDRFAPNSSDGEELPAGGQPPGEPENTGTPPTNQTDDLASAPMSEPVNSRVALDEDGTEVARAESDVLQSDVQADGEPAATVAAGAATAEQESVESNLNSQQIGAGEDSEQQDRLEIDTAMAEETITVDLDDGPMSAQTESQAEQASAESQFAENSGEPVASTALQTEPVPAPVQVASAPPEPVVLDEDVIEETPEPLDESETIASISGSEIEPGEIKIELRAKSDSWIQVRDGDDLLLTRLLRQGEVYTVPERSGLTLMTGNAGGLEVFVGGELVPPLGDVGVVRRGVPLNADRLRTGIGPG